jgi:hypothetical protein
VDPAPRVTPCADPPCVFRPARVPVCADAKGFTALAFPCNQFGGQEPGTAAEIKATVRDELKATFPLFGKIDVNGANTHPVYTFLKKCFPGDITSVPPATPRPLALSPCSPADPVLSVRPFCAALGVAVGTSPASSSSIATVSPSTASRRSPGLISRYRAAALPHPCLHVILLLLSAADSCAAPLFAFHARHTSLICCRCPPMAALVTRNRPLPRRRRLLRRLPRSEPSQRANSRCPRRCERRG